LAYDRDRKAPYYAGAGIRESWIVDLTSNTILVCRAPGPVGYEDVQTVQRGDVVVVPGLDGVTVNVSDVLGAP
jgi:Uma2 family endonuclease